MICSDCGRSLRERETLCPYCGKEFTEAVTLKRQKKILAWVWSLAFLIGMLALFVCFGDSILQFFKMVEEKIGVIKPLSLFNHFIVFSQGLI